MQTHAPHRAGWLPLLTLFAISWLARLAAYGRYITPDELIWVQRSVQFREALLAGNWTATITSGHPGVTTTWLGALGITLQMWVQPASRTAYTWITHLAYMTPDNMAAFDQLAQLLPSARLAVTAVTALGVVIIFQLARHLFDTRTAWLAAGLLALDPFIAGLSGILHVDGLMTTFATIALLTLLLAQFGSVADGARWRLTVAAGIATALALLTKAPSLLLIPISGLIFLVGGWLRHGRSWRSLSGEWLKLGTLWLGAAAITAVLLFPALWAAGGAAFALITSESNRHIEEALRPTFFMGQFNFDHGPLFYPVVVAFRASPVVVLGLMAGLVIAVRRRLPRDNRTWVAAFLLLYAVLFLAGITLAAKKFDRYALPALPPLLLAASYGWHIAAGRWRQWARLGIPALVAVQAVWLLTVWPYPLAAYNPLVGGPWLAERVMALGWGEAISGAASWLADQPGAANATAVAGIGPSFAPFFPGTTLLSAADTVPYGDYLILTAGGVQPARQPDPASFPPGYEWVHTIRYAGRDQGWILSQSDAPPLPQIAQPLPQQLTFDNRVALLALGAEARGKEIEVAAQWQLTAVPDRYTVQIAIEDSSGLTWASSDFDLVNDVTFYPEHWPADSAPTVGYQLKLPDATPPGDYRVRVSLFAAGARLPVLAGDGAFLGLAVAGPTVTKVADGDPLPLNPAQIPVALDASWLDGALHLRGLTPPPSAMTTGFSAPLELFWQTNADLPSGLQVAILLDDSLVWQGAISRYDSGLWPTGTWLRERLRLTVPPDQPGGDAVLALQLLSADGTPLGEKVSLGTVAITAIDRLFALPDAIAQPLDVAFGDALHLRGLDVAATAVPAGGTLDLTLIWQMAQPSEVLLSAFVHLVDDAGQNVAQGDQWPGGLPTDARASQEVVIDRYQIVIPPQTPPGEYRLAVGVYTAVGGTRLAATSPDLLIEDNRVFLPQTITVLPNE